MNLSGKVLPRDVWIVLILGVLALLHGAVYIYIMPPWQHYDEPNHFEYVWLVAERAELPKPGDFDPGMRRDVAISMIENGFFKGMETTTNLDAPNGRIWIGQYPQLNNQPLYYILASVPLWVLPIDDVESQLYAARWVSWVFFLLTIVSAWGVVSEVTPSGHPLRLLVPLSLVLLPGFVDVMTAVNNDTAAVGFLSVALWGSVRLVQRGFSWGTFVVAAVAAILGFFTKELAYFAIPLLLLALPFSVLRGNKRWIVWAALGIGLLACVPLGLSWGDAAYWYRSTTQKSVTRTAENAVLGKYAFRLDSEAETRPRWVRPLFQPIGWFDPGQTYTIGAWMWADKPVTVRTPVLCDGFECYHSAIDLGTKPHFFSTSIHSSNLGENRVSLALYTAVPESGATVYYDGLVLVEGERPLGVQPAYDDVNANRGTWGGKPFKNLLRNGSAESGGPRVRYQVDKLLSKFTPDTTLPSAIVTLYYDWKGAGWYYYSSAVNIFRTFWGKFGWAHVPLSGHKPYRVLAVFTLLGFLGTGSWFGKRLWGLRTNFKRRFANLIPWAASFLLAFLLLSGWLVALSRGTDYLSIVRLYLPVARYTYTAIIPTMLLLSAGWFVILRWLTRWITPSRVSRRMISNIFFIVLFAGLDIYAIISILNYYSWR